MRLGRTLGAGAILDAREAARFGTLAPGVSVIAPASPEEASAVLAFASQEGLRVLPAGRGEWLDGGGRPEADLLLSTRRMRAVRAYEPGDLTCTVEAGLRLDALEEKLEAADQWLPVDPPGYLTGTVGALVAIGQGGPLRAAFGAVRDQVLGVEVVTGDGRLLRWGGRVVKNVAGFDVTRLIVGSWGALGLVTAVSLRLLPRPEADVTLGMPLPGLRSIPEEHFDWRESGLLAASVDVISPGMGGRDGEPWGSGADGAAASPLLLVRLLGSREQVRELEDRLRAISQPGTEGEGWIRWEGAQSRVLQEGLSRWEEGAELSLRMALPPTRIRTLLDEAEVLRDFASRGVVGEGGPTVGIRVYAHLRSGTVRVCVPTLGNAGPDLEAWAGQLEALRSRLEGGGGWLDLFRAPAVLMEAVGAFSARAGSERRLMRSLKESFDPAGVLAPGRFGL